MFILKIADFFLKIDFDLFCEAEAAKNALSKFIYASNEVDLQLKIHHGPAPKLDGWEQIFQTENTWKLFRSGNQYAFSKPLGFHPMVGIFDDQFLHGDIYLPNQEVPGESFALENFFYQFMFIHHLTRGYGVLLHAAAVVDGGVGRLFVGNSGAGKSTIASLWQSSGKARVLCDDRIIVRKREGRFWMYGTPWFGTAGIAIPDGAPIDQVFILKQASDNEIIALSPLQAVSSLLARAFPTYWDQSGMAFTVDFLTELSQSVPCHVLEFLPEPGVIETVRCLQ
jgi:hypothetical protein